MEMDIKDKKLFLLDMDGTIYLDDRLFDGVGDFLEKVREKGITLVIVDQDVNRSLTNSDYTYVMLEGRIVMAGESKKMNIDEVNDAYFGINLEKKEA